MVKSTHEFIELTKVIENAKLLASLDVEGLVTSVPVLETIKIICKTYHRQKSHEMQ